MRNSLLLVLVVLCGCSKAEVPNLPLLRIESEWTQAPLQIHSPARIADASILVFRANGEFVEHYCRVLEQPDGTLFLARRDPHVVAAGRWKRSFSTITATREKVARTTPSSSKGKDPLCENPEVKFVLSKKSIVSRVVGDRKDPYELIDRLVAPDLESYENRARKSGVSCVETDD